MFMVGQIRQATSYNEICNDLRQEFMTGAMGETSVRLVGLLFARPDSKLAKEDVIPHLPYLHVRSAKHAYFYCGGYWKDDLPPDPGSGRVQVMPGWMYSNNKFDSFRADIESRSRWKYSGGVDLILTNARFHAKRGWEALLSQTEVDVEIDFCSAISINLAAAKTEGAISSVEELFEQICRYAETQTGEDPAWGFSDSKGRDLGASALKQLLLSFLPAWATKDASKAFHFAVADISANPRLPASIRRLRWWYCLVLLGPLAGAATRTYFETSQPSGIPDGAIIFGSLFGMLLILAAVWLFERGIKRRIMRRAVAAEHRLCPTCLHLLAGESGTCPECRSPFTLRAVLESWAAAKA